nr:uncharacterized protein K02A2.6-like [Hydra vulgaris]
MVNVKINGSEVSMEVDTGAAVSVMGISAYKRIKKNEGKLQNSGVVLKTYTGELIRPEGIGLVEVVYNGQCCKLPITVVKGNVPTLMGRDWMQRLTLQWFKRMRGINFYDKVDSRVKTLLEKYPEVFSNRLGTRIEQELDCLEDQGVWRKVQYSKWAALIVPVLKNSKDPTGPIRICGDYKITVNQAAPVDSYPIPNITDQLATIAGGERYTKLDLSQAYQQLELDETSREFLTINTHQGLYQPTHLQFDVHSTTGIFQREMDRRLGRLSFVKVQVDDILISWKTDAEHLNNLESVLKILKESGLTLKVSKCSFMQPEVEFCGFIISQKAHFNPSRKIVVHCDASRYGVRAVLSQQQYDGSEKPVSFASRTLNMAERNYAQIEKEGLALVIAVKKFHQFLFGQKFRLYTDHKPLLGLFSESKAARVLRWALLLSAYDYQLLYCPGEKYATADGLSRLPLDVSKEKSRLKTIEVAMLELVKTPITEKQLRGATQNDPILGVVLNRVLEGGLTMEPSKVEMKPFALRFSELSTEEGCLLWGRRVIVPSVLRETVLEELHEVHPGMKALA